MKLKSSGALCQILMALETLIQKSDCNCSGKTNLRVTGSHVSKWEFVIVATSKVTWLHPVVIRVIRQFNSLTYYCFFKNDSRHRRVVKTRKMSG